MGFIFTVNIIMMIEVTPSGVIVPYIKESVT